jgi:uncharacterized GH25 family protein
MKKQLFLFAIFCVMNAFSIVSAHGIHIDYSFNYPVVSLEIYFSKTSPLVNAGVEVFSPHSGELFVSGKTDKNGNFEFSPDGPGDWTVKVDDGMGHRKKLVITIEDLKDQLASEQGQADESGQHSHDHALVPDHHHENGPGECQIPVFYKILFGLSVIFGVTGIWYGLKARKK